MNDPDAHTRRQVRLQIARLRRRIDGRLDSLPGRFSPWMAWQELLGRVRNWRSWTEFGLGLAAGTAAGSGRIPGWPVVCRVGRLVRFLARRLKRRFAAPAAQPEPRSPDAPGADHA